MTWAMTRNLEEAMASDMYIGETFAVPTIICNAIREQMGKRLLKPVRLIYYGLPDRRLRRKFGYPDEVAQNQ